MAAAAPTAASYRRGDQPLLSDDDRHLWRTRILAGLADRRQYEPLWEECLAFAEGHQWIAYEGTHNRQLVTIRNPDRTERVTNDELTQFRLTLLGELELDDDRPQALFRQNEAPSEDYAEQANAAIQYGWDEEWRGDPALLDGRRTVIDVGTAPMRVRFDPDYGDELPDEVPFIDGRWVSTQEAIKAFDQGKVPELRKVRAGRIVWEAGTPFNTITPPRVHREHLFPWVVWVSVHSLDDLKQRYPHAAGELAADQIRSVAKVTSVDQETPLPDEHGSEGLDKQCFLYTAYENPCPKYPQGRVVLLGSSRMVPLETRPTLDYRGPDGHYRSGVHFLHAIRLTDRFWSRGFMELGLSPQRVINTRLTQINQTINRAQPKTYLEKGSLDKMPSGKVMEAVWLRPGKPKPIIDPGASPGPWMQQSIDANRANLERAVLPDVALGKNPANVNTIGQLAMLRDQAMRRLGPMLNEQRQVIVDLCADSVCDIKRYWGTEKRIQAGGVEGGLNEFTFNASAWPDYTKFTFAKGAALPRGQGAQLTLIENLWQAALNSGAARIDPAAWLAWYHDSLQAGKPLDLPLPPGDPQREKAQYENELLTQGIDEEQAFALVDYFDQHELHIIEHRQIQGHARLMDRPDIYIACEAHIRAHQQHAMANAMQAPPESDPDDPADPADDPTQSSRGGPDDA